MGNNLKKIGTFQEFIQKNKTLKEDSQLAVNIPFWEEAIENVMSDLHSIAGTPIDFDLLSNYAKTKFIILGKDLISSDLMIIEHIKDLLFNYYGQSYFIGGENTSSGHSYDVESTAAKTLVLSQLAEEIFKQARIDAGILIEPEPDPISKPVATVALGNCCDYDEYDNLPFESMRKVRNFSSFSTLLEENIISLSYEHNKKCIDYCIDKIKKDAGSLLYDDVMSAADDEGKSLDEYISSIVKAYLLKNDDFKLDGEHLKDGTDQAMIIKQARELFAYQITKTLIGEIELKPANYEKAK